jgi:hypothetical protein
LLAATVGFTEDGNFLVSRQTQFLESKIKGRLVKKRYEFVVRLSTTEKSNTVQG